MMFITHTEPSAAFSVRGKEGPQGDKEWIGKDETHPTLLALHSFPSSVDIQQGYSHLSMALANTPQENELDVWFQQTMQVNMSTVAGKKYLQQESESEEILRQLPLKK